MWDDVKLVNVTGGRAMDVTPGMSARAIVSGLRVADLEWGFKSFEDKLIINARAEGIRTKPTFAESISKNRCVLPASGFYEWDQEKEKVTFTLKNTPVIYLAGIYEDGRFVIITREANESVINVHDRMPLMIDENDVESWIEDSTLTDKMLHRKLPALQLRMDYEQMRFF